MTDNEEHTLDVNLEVLEEPLDYYFPRQPNVVSHRGHQAKIIVTIHDVPDPEGTKTITLNATVLVFDKERAGNNGHVCSAARIWGTAEKVTVAFPWPGWPRPYVKEIIVSRGNDDDHLGEGPYYQGLVNVTTSNEAFNAERTTEGDSAGNDEEAAATGRAALDDDGLHIIEFMSM